MPNIERSTVVVFRVGPVQCAIPSFEVLQVILPPRELMRIPWAGPEVVGLFDYQARPATAISLPRKFGYVAHQDLQTGLVMVAECPTTLTGFWVDDVLNVLTMDPCRWQPMPQPLSPAVFDGVFVDDNGDLLFTTEMARLRRMPCEPVHPAEEWPVARAGSRAKAPSALPAADAMPVQASAEAMPQEPSHSIALPGVDMRRRATHEPEPAPAMTPLSTSAPTALPAAPRREPKRSMPTPFPAATLPPSSASGGPPQAWSPATPSWKPDPATAPRAGTIWGLLPWLAAAALLVALASLVATIPLPRNEPHSSAAVRTETPMARQSPDRRPRAPRPVPATTATVHGKDTAPDTGEPSRQAPTVPAIDSADLRVRSLPRESKPAALPSRRIIFHVVKRGDTLWDITERYLGDPFRYPEVARWSGIEDPHWIEPGDVVRIVMVGG